MEQQIKEKKEELPIKNRIGHNKNISTRMDKTDNKSVTSIPELKRQKGVFGKLREEESESTFDSLDEQLMFNGKPVIKGPENIMLFCEKLVPGDLYIKHYREGNAYFSQWVIHSEAGEKGTRKVKSTNSLDVSNKQRDSQLKKLAKEYRIDVEEHLTNIGGFVNNHADEIFPKAFSLVDRSRKDSQLIGIANKLEEKYNIVKDKLTGYLHIYNENKGIYVPYNETEFSSFLKKEYKQKFLMDEVTKIMGTFNTIKEESERYIAFKNCLLNVETLETSEFTSKEFVKFQVPYNWNPKAESKIFRTRIKEILVDEEAYKLFLQIVGYCFTPNNHHHKMFFITGIGGNGKSTLMGIISQIFHSSVAAVGLHEFKNDFGLQPLLGKKINILYDLPTKAIKDTGIIKAVTGEDLITINRKHKEAVSTMLGCKIIGTGNQLPAVDDDTYAFWRRVVHITLTNTFKDPTVREKILNDTAGIEMLIYEAITAYKHVETDGWAAQKTIEEKRKEYLKLSDPCKYAAEELFESTADPHDQVSREEVVSLISKFLKTEGIKLPTSHEPYFKAIRDMGGEDKYSGTSYTTSRVFAFIKTKKVTEIKEKADLEALARNGDEEAQAELDYQKLQSMTEKGNES